VAFPDAEALAATPPVKVKRPIANAAIRAERDFINNRS
jgi:hypothetical protein